MSDGVARHFTGSDSFVQVASFVNAESWREIVFTRNASEAVNLVAHAWGTANLKPGDEVSFPHSCQHLFPTHAATRFQQ